MIWPKNGLRRASVNSFGYGGSNAHVILDDAYHYLKSHGLNGRHRTAPNPPKSLLSGQNEAMVNGTCGDQYRVFIWSTNDEKGIDRVVNQFKSHLDGKIRLTQDYLQKLAYTLSERRTHLPWKAFMVASNPDELKNGLDGNFISTPVRSSVGLEPYLALVFTGQGAQWIGMGRELTIYPAFMASLRHAEKFLSSLGCDWRVIGKYQDLLGHYKQHGRE